MPRENKKIKIKKDIEKNPIVKVRVSFLNRKIIFLLRRFIFILLIFLLIAILALLIKSPDLRIKISNFIYWNSVKIISKDICLNIDIKGIKYSDIDLINEYNKEFCESSDKNIKYNIANLANKISAMEWIKDVYIVRKLPYNLSINIIEYNEYALWQDDAGVLHLIDEYGDIIKVGEKDKISSYNMFVVGGAGSKENINSLFNLLSLYPEISENINQIIRAGERRWDFHMKNKIVIQMPESYEDMLVSLNNLKKIMQKSGWSYNVKKIDMRNTKKTYIAY